jgi:hypothetical protein
MQPLGLNAAGDKPGLIRGFAVVSTDSGHKSHHPGFDFAFVKDQQAYLDFAYLANAEGATLAKQVILRKACGVFILLWMLHRRPRRHDSVATLSNSFQRDHFR